MTRRRGPHSDDVDRLRAALEQLGGESSVHQLMLRTGLDPSKIDKKLRQVEGVERASAVGRGVCADGSELAERRWRIRRPAP